MKKVISKKMAAASVVVVLFAGILSQGLVSELGSEKEALAQVSLEPIGGGVTVNQTPVEVRCTSTGTKGILCDAGGSSCTPTNPCN